MSDKPSFNPASIDAMFATIIVRLDHMQNDVAEIKEQTIRTNGRVNNLEAWRQGIVVRVSTITGLAGMVSGIIAWGISVGLHKLWPQS